MHEHMAHVLLEEQDFCVAVIFYKEHTVCARARVCPSNSISQCLVDL